MKYNINNLLLTFALTVKWLSFCFWPYSGLSLSKLKCLDKKEILYALQVCTWSLYVSNKTSIVSCDDQNYPHTASTSLSSRKLSFKSSMFICLNLNSQLTRPWKSLEVRNVFWKKFRWAIRNRWVMTSFGHILIISKNV